MPIKGRKAGIYMTILQTIDLKTYLGIETNITCALVSNPTIALRISLKAALSSLKLDVVG